MAICLTNTSIYFNTYVIIFNIITFRPYASLGSKLTRYMSVILKSVNLGDSDLMRDSAFDKFRAFFVFRTEVSEANLIDKLTLFYYSRCPLHSLM